MFDLDAFDAEIDRRTRVEAPGDDVLLAHVMRPPQPHAALTPFGTTSGSVFGALALIFLVSPMIFGSGSAEAMMDESMMSIEEFSVHMNMDPYDPLLIALYEEVCMT
jgi:hypothetical protein